MNSANIKYACIFKEEKNNRINITMVARRLQSSISYSSNICVDIGVVKDIYTSVFWWGCGNFSTLL
jgi:hypothetical protein